MDRGSTAKGVDEHLSLVDSSTRRDASGITRTCGDARTQVRGQWDGHLPERSLPICSTEKDSDEGGTELRAKESSSGYKPSIKSTGGNTGFVHPGD